MVDAVLYVICNKASAGGSPGVPPVYYNSMNYPVGSSGSPRDFFVLKREDEEAVIFLQEKRILFDIVDLTQTPIASRLWSKLSRMKTPTLIIKGNRLVGLKNIKEAIEEKAT